MRIEIMSKCEVMGTDKLTHGEYIKMVKKGQIRWWVKISYSISLFCSH